MGARIWVFGFPSILKSFGERLRDDALAKQVRKAFHSDDQDDDDQGVGEHVLVMQQAVGEVEVEADPTSAEDAERNRRTEVDVKGIEEIRDERRSHLGKNPVTNKLQPGASDALNGLGDTRV